MLIILKAFDILNPNIWKKYSSWKHLYIYMLVWKGLEKNRIILPKCNVIILNIYIFNAFVVKILATNLTFGYKVHKSKNIYYNIEWQGINAQNKHYIL